MIDRVETALKLEVDQDGNGRVDGRLVDTSYLIESDATLAIVTDKDAAGLANLIAEWAKLAPKPAAVAFWKGELHWLKKEYKAADRVP